MSESQYLSNQICRVLRLTKQLAGCETTGKTCSELAELLETTPSQVLRDLTNLKEEGFAERCSWDDNRWRLGHAFVRISNTVRVHLEQSQLQLQQDVTNYNKFL